jgi:C4-dicarboxylate transporter/malic acid transport protein
MVTDQTGGAGGAATTPEIAPLARLRGFHPGWFGAVMGTAVIGVAASLNPGGVAALAPAARALSQAMVGLAAGLAVVLAIPYLGRWFVHRDAAVRDLRDPVAGALYGTLPAGILVLAVATATVGPAVFSPSTDGGLVAGLAWAGVPLAFVMSLVFAYLLFVRSELVHETVNGGWFIPPVATIIVPLVLVPLVPGSPPPLARALMLGAYGFWGMGFMLYLLIATTLHHRLVVHPLPHAGLAPSFWIGLGPIGVGTVALIKMAAAGSAIFGPLAHEVALASTLAATALWGFGVWWLCAATILLVHYLRSGPLPYGVGWWAFTFPLGAYTVATVTVARAWNLGGLEWAGAGLFVLLCGFWLLVVSGTLRALRAGRLWRPAAPVVGTSPGRVVSAS